MEQSALTGIVRKPSVCLGLSSAAPALWPGVLAGQECLSHVPGALLQPDRRLWPLWQPGDAHCGFGLGQGGGLFPGYDSQGFASSCWRHRFPARHSMSWDLWLRPRSCLIRSNHS